MSGKVNLDLEDGWGRALTTVDPFDLLKVPVSDATEKSIDAEGRLAYDARDELYARLTEILGGHISQLDAKIYEEIREALRIDRAPSTHSLKTHGAAFELVKSGLKTHELRRNDRDFRVGDRLWLKEFVRHGRYTGRGCLVLVTAMTLEEQYGLQKGHCCMSIKLLEDNRPFPVT